MQSSSWWCRVGAGLAAVRGLRRWGTITTAFLVLLGAGEASIALAGASGAATSALAPQVLARTVPQLVALARNLGALDPAKRIEIELPLLLPSLAAMNAYVSGEYIPGSRDYHEFLKPRQFGERFGASTTAIASTVNVLDSFGLKVAAPTANHLYLSATGTVVQLERAFGVKLDSFKLSTGRAFFANTTDIKLPASLSGLVSGVIGLDDSSVPKPQLALPKVAVGRSAHVRAVSQVSPSTQGVDGGATPCAQAVASGGYTAPALAQAYDFNGLYAQGFHGEGMSAALVEYDDFHDSNVATMESCYGIKTAVTRRLVDGGSGGPPAAGEAEDMADITTLLEMAPDLAHLYVYVAPNTNVAEFDLFNAYVNDDDAPVLSSSWGNCEELQSQSYDQLFSTFAEEAAAQGQQIFEAAGDSGAVDCRGYPSPTEGSISVEQEAAVPWVTGVGGTDLGERSTFSGSGVRDEDTWNDSGAGGGGQSAVWSTPSYEANYLSAVHDSVPGAANDCDSSTGLCRMVPDISMNADPDAGGATDGGPVPPQFALTDVGSPGDDTYCATPNCAFATLVGGPALPVGEPSPAGAGGWYPIGGTSLATPTAAAAAVLWDQEAKAAGLGSFGFLNPSLYEIASNASEYASDFHDITTDSNDAEYDATDCPSGCNPNGLYKAGTGYDMASGLGSIDASNLGAALVKQAEQVQLSPSDATMYGYLNGPTTTQPVSVTSGYLGSSYTAMSSASWLHVISAGTVPGTLSWYVDPTGLTAGTYTGTITVTGKGGSTATLSVTYSVGPRATISVSPSALGFSERAIDSSDDTTTAACGSTIWNDELMDSPDFEGGDYDTYEPDPSTLNKLTIGNSGPSGSALHYEVYEYSQTSSWLTPDLNPSGAANTGNGSSGFQAGPSQPLDASSGSLAGGGSAIIKLASIANGNTLGGYPDMNQGTYTGEVDIRDLADPSVLVKVPVALVLGNGTGTPTTAAAPSSFAVNLNPGQSTTVNLVLSDSGKTCGYAYSLATDQPWATANPDLYSGTVGATPATSPPSASDTGGGNGYTPITISAAGLAAGVYHANVIVNSQNAGPGVTRIPITLTVGGPTTARLNTGVGLGPHVYSIVPAQGSAAGGEQVTINGSGFEGAGNVCSGSYDVWFGTDLEHGYAITPTSYGVRSDAQIRAVVPANFGSAVDVRVHNRCGTSPIGSGDRFTYEYPANQCLSGTCSIKIGSSRVGQLRHAALGLLDGLNTDAGVKITRNEERLVQALHPRQWRLGQAWLTAPSGGVFGLAHRVGAQISLDLTSDWEDWAYDANRRYYLTPYGDLSTYYSFIYNDVKRRIAAGEVPDYFDVWNEPVATGSVNQWLSVYGTAYRAIKAADPSAQVVGPSIAFFLISSADHPNSPGYDLSLTDFLNWEMSSGARFAAISWHEDGTTVGAAGDSLVDGLLSEPVPGGHRDYWSPAAIATHVSQAKALIASYPALHGTQVFVNEYGPTYAVNVPGWMVGDFASLEGAGADQGMITCATGSGCSNLLDGLIGWNGSPQMPYWVMRAYSQMSGERVRTSASGPNLYALATRVGSAKTIEALIGRADDCWGGQQCPQFQRTSDRAVRLSLSVAIPWRVRTVQVRMQPLRNSARRPIGRNNVPSAPACTAMTVAVRSGRATIPVGQANDGDAFYVTLSPAKPRGGQPQSAMSCVRTREG